MFFVKRLPLSLFRRQRGEILKQPGELLDFGGTNLCTRARFFKAFSLDVPSRESFFNRLKLSSVFCISIKQLQLILRL